MPSETAAAVAAPHASREVGAEAFSEGLLLVRASAIRMVRFQLAMERQDRRLALETVDDLLLLDRRIENFLTDLPRLAGSAHALERELEDQRQALAREKFTLAAGVVREAVGASSGDTPLQDPVPEDELLLTEPALAPARVASFVQAGRTSQLIAAGLLLFLAALTCAVLFILTNSGTP